MHKVEKISDGLQRIIDLVRDAGGETSGDGQLFRAKQGLLGERVLLNLIADLILPLPAAKGDLQRTKQSLGTNRPLEQEDISQRPAQLPQALTLERDPATDGEQDNRKVGPGGLMS